MKLINSPWNDKAKKEQLHNRLKEFARDFMIDHNRIETLVSRTRKEWEDYDVNQTTATLQGLAKLAAAIVSSPGVQKLLDNREAQEKIRLFLIGLSVSRLEVDDMWNLG
jgi:type II secretory pathway component PulL